MSILHLGLTRAVVFMFVLNFILPIIPNESAIFTSLPQNANKIVLSSVVWSDDFNDENLDDWSIDWWFPYAPQDYVPNISVAGGSLQLFGTSQFPGPGAIIATHNSTVAYGTWIFDIRVSDEGPYWASVVIMSPKWFDFEHSPEGYAFLISTDTESNTHSFSLCYIYPDLAGAFYYKLGRIHASSYSGWHHIEITRLSDNMFNVYVNGSLSLQVLDNRLTSSEYFRLVAWNYTVVDNISVSNSVDIDRISPRWIQIPTNQTIFEGEEFRYDLNATDYSGIDTWWLNDTENFCVDVEGVITSSSLLSSGIYGIEVFVNDTFGNVLKANFNVEVRQNIFIFTLGIGVTGGLVVIVLLFLKSRYSPKKLGQFLKRTSLLKTEIT